MGAVACWVCGQAARGFSHTDLRFPPADPRRYPLRWTFCSLACQDAFHTLYDLRRWDDPATIEDLLPVNFPLSPSAQTACIQAVARAAEQVGFDTPLSQYTRPQILALIAELLTTYEALLHKGKNPTAPAVDFDDQIPFDEGHDAMNTDCIRRVVPEFADLRFFIDGRETWVADIATTSLPDTDGRTRDETHWTFPIKAHRPSDPLPVAEALNA